MKLWFGLLGAAMMLAFLGAVALKVGEPALWVVVAVGVVLMGIDLWQARAEPDR
ncbi:MAG: hypothetical protein KGL18_10335 [Burkholderiales bacterium]|nr:hypothetical protein [Burkholderiales bacterium]MDE1925805.1 hypothetical protein [Burkholderiales bacterium]MDE2157293.1 hypothetical protein [Burkholderiales bacterium]MDE2503358.1 hypothetical protein [Burkholderiales bacterium]